MFEMSKVVKKTYGKKTNWEAGDSRAFDEAKVQTLKNIQSPKKLARPSIWAKVPLFESLSPQKTKKKLGPGVTLSPARETTTVSNDSNGSGKKRGRKRKNEDIFGFGDLDDEVIPATEYISPKKKKKEQALELTSPSKTKNKNGKISKKQTNQDDKTTLKKSPKTKSPSKSPQKGKAMAKVSPKQKSKKKKSEKSPKKGAHGNKKLTETKPKNIRNSKKLTNGTDSPQKDIKSNKNNKKSLSSDNDSPEKKKSNTPVKSPNKRSKKESSLSTKGKSPVAKELFGKKSRKTESDRDASSKEDKNKIVEVIDQDQSVSDQPVIKRKRGRPPKKHPKILAKNNDALTNIGKFIEENDVTESLSQETSTESSQLKDVSSSQESVIVCSSNSENTPQIDASLLAPEVTKALDDKDCSDEVVEMSESQPQNSTQASSKDSKGSPFKWFLKNNEKTLSPRRVAQLRRISVLPTCTPDKEENNSEVDSVPFGLSWAMQTDDNALRVNKEDKELFTIVRNTKQAHESVEFGESQQFKDDVDYLLDGIGNSNSLSTRCLSLLELASKCSKSAFRMHLRAHGTVSMIFQKLDDAPSNQNLALCTAAVMFMLTRDRLSIDFDKSILEMMLKLLTVEEDEETCNSKEWTRLTKKLQAIFEKNDIQGINNLNLSQLTSASLARESFLSLTLQRTGSWFKEEIRLLGGLDHIVDTVVSCSKMLLKSDIEIKPESNTNLRQIERCLKLLENVTGQCVTNQKYLIAYRNSALLESCARLLKYAVNGISNEKINDREELAAMWFSTMKILLNLTHDNEDASAKFCQQTDVLCVLLKSAFQLPKFLPEPKQFDVIVLSLGLLINLIEHSKKNIAALNAVSVSASYESSQNEGEVVNESEDRIAVELLIELFLVRLDAAKDNNGMEEDLSKLNDSLHNSSIRIGPDGLSLVCGDDLDSTQNNDESACKQDSVEPASGGKTAAEEKAEHLGKALQRAGKHMEDSLIASYAALLIALLAEDNQENQERIHGKLTDGDFGLMKHTLDKFLAFMNMTANPSNSSSSEVIKRAIKVLAKCVEIYPTRKELEDSSCPPENCRSVEGGYSQENSSCTQVEGSEE